MSDLLSTLHDTDNRGLSLVVTVGGHTFVCLLVLGFGFFGLDLIDFDAVFWVGEVEVDVECVLSVDVFSFWGFAKNAIASACKGLEGSFELDVIWITLAGSAKGQLSVFNLTYQDRKPLASQHMTLILPC